MAYTWGQGGTTTKVRVPGGGNTYFKVYLNESLANNNLTSYAVNGANNSTYLEFLAQYTDTPGTAVSQAQEIHPIGSPYPVEIATAYAQHAGTLQLQFWQQWGEDGWYSAFAAVNNGTFYKDANNAESGFADSPYGFAKATLSNEPHRPVDLYQVLRAQRKNGGQIGIQKFELGGDGSLARVKTYWGAVITDIQQPENGISVSSMEVRCTVSIMYAFSSMHYCNTSAANGIASYLV